MARVLLVAVRRHYDGLFHGGLQEGERVGTSIGSTEAESPNPYRQDPETQKKPQKGPKS